MNRNALLGLTAAAALFAGGPALVAAQGVTVTPLIGAYVPAGSFHELQDQAGKLERGSTLGLGFNVELGMFRGSFAYATGATISRDGIQGRSNIGDGSVL